MEPEGSTPHSQVPATCPYPEPAPTNKLHTSQEQKTTRPVKKLHDFEARICLFVIRNAPTKV